MTLYALSFDLLFSLPSLEQHHFPSPSHLGHWMNLTYGLQSQCTWRLLEVGHEFISMPRSIVARHPRRALSNSSSFLCQPPQRTPPSFPSDLGVQDQPVTKNDTYQQRSLYPGKTGRALYCGGGMLSVFAVDSDDYRSSNVTRTNGSPDIGCSPSETPWMHPVATLKAVATTTGELLPITSTLHRLLIDCSVPDERMSVTARTDNEFFSLISFYSNSAL